MEKKMGFFEAVSQVIRKSFVFKGRARRKEFWSWTLFSALLNIVVTVALMMMSSSETVQTCVSLFLALLMFFPGFSVAVRRLHDVGRSGWWLGGYYIVTFVYMLILASLGLENLGEESFSTAIVSGALSLVFILIALIWAIVMLVWDFTEGTNGPNKYGEDPKRDERIDGDTSMTVAS